MMEEGSLLAEALNHHARRGGGGGGGGAVENVLENALIVDVFLGPPASSAPGNDNNNNNNGDVSYSSSSSSFLEQELLDLADLAVELNNFIQDAVSQKKAHDEYNYKYYPWIQGGDGPVFGIHTSSSNHYDDDHTTTTTTATTTRRMKNIPHLRAICCYGVSVADEWKLISLVMEYSSSQRSSISDNSSGRIVVAECIDVDDGQILMIQGADALPEWPDRIGPDNCRHRCWIKQGKVHLIAPPAAPLESSSQPATMQSSRRRAYSLSLSQALDCLFQDNNSCGTNKNSSNVNLCQYHAGVHERVQEAIDRVVEDVNSNSKSDNKHCQRTALLVPRSVAHLVDRRPDLAAAAFQAWAQSQQQEQQQDHDYGQGESKRGRHDNQKDSSSSSSPLLAGTCHDWIWTVDQKMGRTAYAMMRTMVSGGGQGTAAGGGARTSTNNNDDDWSTPDSIPKRFQSIEVKRLQRHVQSLHPPVLQSSLALGVRLVAGLDVLLQQQSNNNNNNKSADPLRQSHAERRVLDYWSRIDRDCRANTRSSNPVHDQNNESNNWLAQAWTAGPNHARYNLDSILKCPVYLEEVQDGNVTTPLSHPDMTLADQIRQELLRTQSETLENEVPRPDQVDDDAWMTLPETMTDQDFFFQQTLGLASPLLNEKTGTDDNTKDKGAATLDQVLHGFQDFIQGESGVDGVDNVHHPGSSSTKNDGGAQEKRQEQQQQPIRIRPAAFLNLLHKSLATESAQELEAFLNGTIGTTTTHDGDGDQFFSEEDYRLAEPDSSDDDTSDDDDEEDDNEMMGLMDAMDSQLERDGGKELSRPCTEAAGDGLLNTANDEQQRVQQQEIAQDVHVLSNLMESLESGAGAPGPVKNILSEMSSK